MVKGGLTTRGPRNLLRQIREAMAGGVRLLHKPISADVLLEAVQQLVPARAD